MARRERNRPRAARRRLRPGDTDWSDCTPGEESAGVDLAAEEDKEITIGAFNGWDESYAAAHITKYALEQDGFTVNVESFDAGPAFTAVSEGDIDFLMDSWLPVTHEDYIAQFGDGMEAQGCRYIDAKNTIAVNEDSPAQSMARTSSSRTRTWRGWRTSCSPTSTDAHWPADRTQVVTFWDAL